MILICILQTNPTIHHVFTSGSAYAVALAASSMTAMPDRSLLRVQFTIAFLADGIKVTICSTPSAWGAMS